MTRLILALSLPLAIAMVSSPAYACDKEDCPHAEKMEKKSADGTHKEGMKKDHECKGDGECKHDKDGEGMHKKDGEGMHKKGEGAKDGHPKGHAVAPAKPKTIEEAWAPLLTNPGMATFFDGIFVDLGVRIEETGDELTVHHKGDHFTLEKGIDAAKVDYVVPITLENAGNLVMHGADETVDPEEAYLILGVMFTPMTQATLAASPVIRSKKLRRIAGVEELIHVELLTPKGEVGTTHTLAFVGDQWLVIPGLQGDAERVFHMTVDDAAEYQRHIFAAMQGGETKDWKAFAKWYNAWREGVSTVK